MNTTSKLSAGGEIDSWCTRCKMDLGHRIVAMVGAAPKRVVCQTCGSEHNYRAPRSEQGKAPRAPRKTATRASGTGGTAKGRVALQARAEWEQRVRSGKPFRRFRIEETFAEGDLIQHKKFGEGYVVVATPEKITVAFSDGERTLVHGKKL